LNILNIPAEKVKICL